MHRGAHLKRRDQGQEKGEPPLPPLATGIALGLWVTGMVVLAFVVVPAIFATCRGGVPGS